MALPNYGTHVQFEFLHPSGNGWSETYWLGVTDLFQTMLNLQAGNAKASGTPATYTMAYYRRRILPPSCHFTAIRLSVDGQSHQGFYQSIPAQYSAGLLTPGDVGAYGGSLSILPVTDTLLLNLLGNAPSLAKKPLYLGGLNNTLVNPATSKYQSPTNWADVLLLFLGSLTSNGWYIRSRPVAQGAALPITAFAVNPSAQTAWVQCVNGNPAINIPPQMAGGAGINPGFVVIRGLRYPRGWNGTHKANATTPPSALPAPFVGGLALSLGPTRRANVSEPTWDPNSGGTVQFFAPVYQVITNPIVQGLVKRSRGRPFGVPHGSHKPVD